MLNQVVQPWCSVSTHHDREEGVLQRNVQLHKNAPDMSFSKAQDMFVFQTPEAPSFRREAVSTTGLPEPAVGHVWPAWPLSADFVAQTCAARWECTFGNPGAPSRIVTSYKIAQGTLKRPAQHGRNRMLCLCYSIPLKRWPKHCIVQAVLEHFTPTE